MVHPIIKTMAVCSILFIGCYYDKASELYPSTKCDTSQVTYSEEVVAILTNNACIACHNAVSPGGSIALDTYADVKIYVDNGRLLGSIKHRDGFVAMPLNSGSRIDACEIDKIEAWIYDGARNN